MLQSIREKSFLAFYAGWGKSCRTNSNLFIFYILFFFNVKIIFYFKDMNDNKKFTYLLLYVTLLSLDNFFQFASNRGAYSALRDFFPFFLSERFDASTFKWEDAQASPKWTRY